MSSNEAAYDLGVSVGQCEEHVGRVHHALVVGGVAERSVREHHRVLPNHLATQPVRVEQRRHRNTLIGAPARQPAGKIEIELFQSGERPHDLAQLVGDVLLHLDTQRFRGAGVVVILDRETRLELVDHRGKAREKTDRDVTDERIVGN